MNDLIISDWAYKSPRRKGRGTGRQGLQATLKYLQYRDNAQDHIQQDGQIERWVDRGLGTHYRAIFESCDRLQSKHVLAWTWVVSPAPDLMALIPDDLKRDMVCELTERIVEDYYLARGYHLPEYSYVLHNRLTDTEDGIEPLEQLHTHVILPGTAPTADTDMPMYNNGDKGHIELLKDISNRHMTEILDELIGPEWYQLRSEPKPELPPTDDLDLWFPRMEIG
ncbi:MAG: hypothetical protein J0M33_28955 [Anaerolineae bacterium]|nr:hypothetical protein [Anaerolineae bacterium]